MRTMNDILTVTAKAEYGRRFRDALRMVPGAYDDVSQSLEGERFMYIPQEEGDKFHNLLVANGVIRGLASGFRMYQGGSTIPACESDDYAQFVSEGDSIPVVDAMDDFTQIDVESHKVASLAKVPMEFVLDSGFNVEDYIMKRMARSFAKAEDKAFVNGTGTDEPTGLLHDTEGAETADSVDAITFDDCIGLFFSVKPEYRKNAVWLMNDSTALAMRKLKDEDGNHLWDSSRDTILGRRVVICNEMPDIEAGKKPLLFGDLSYYWILDRSIASLKPLHELFAENGQVGYICQERLDGKLIRTEAVKVLAIASEEDVG